MSKTARQYADEVRELRALGYDFPASRGYTLANASQWSTGQKAAVSRAYNSIEDVDVYEEEIDSGGFTEDEGLEYFADAYGDDLEEWDDIDYFDWSEGDDFEDEVVEDEET